MTTSQRRTRDWRVGTSSQISPFLQFGSLPCILVSTTALLHPDRHRDPALKSAADHRFQEINRAFEILGDPKQRAVYDELGYEGLKTQWEVGSKYKTAAEVSTPGSFLRSIFVFTFFAQCRCGQSMRGSGGSSLRPMWRVSSRAR